MTRTELVETLRETVMKLQQEQYPEVDAEMVRRVLAIHHDPSLDERARFRAVRSLLEAEASE